MRCAFDGFRVRSVADSVEVAVGSLMADRFTYRASEGDHFSKLSGVLDFS